MITRGILLIFFCLSGFIGFSQKRHDKTQENTFPYSYKCEGKDYVKIDVYSFQLTQLNEDSLLLSGDGGTEFLHGTISYSQDTFSGKTTTENGKFLLKIPNITSTSPFIVQLEFETHETTDVWLNWSKEIPRSFFVETPRKSIFDGETGSIIIHSKTSLSDTDVRNIVDCLGTRKQTGIQCYDENFIRILIAI